MEVHSVFDRLLLLHLRVDERPLSVPIDPRSTIDRLTGHSLLPHSEVRGEPQVLPVDILRSIVASAYVAPLRVPCC